VAVSRKSGEGGRAPAGARRRRADDDREYARDEQDAGAEDEIEEIEDSEESEAAADGEEAERPREAEPAAAAGRSGGRRSRRALSARDAGEAGLRHLTGIIPKTVEGITAVRPDDDGWTVEVEILDAKHIPSSSDTLALYEVEIDDEGELMSYRRIAQYSRAKGREAP
jgi:hypothetical protein